MLSESEQRMLHQIEHSVAMSDPDLAALLSAPLGRHPGRRARLAHDLVFVFALLLALPCLAWGQVGPGLGVLLFAMVVLHVRRVRFGPLIPSRDRRRRRPGSSR